MAAIVLFGASGHGKVVADMVERESRHRIVGFIDTYKTCAEVFGYPVLGTEQQLPALCKAHRVDGVVVTIGDNWLRAEAVTRVKELVPHLPFITVVHPSAVLGRGVSLGCGTVVMAGAVINSDSRIGDFCIINTRASVDHDNLLGDYVHICSAAATSGNVQIGSYSLLGVGAQVIHNVKIGSHSLIGAGSTVVEDIPDLVVAEGAPARVAHSREKGVMGAP